VAGEIRVQLALDALNLGTPALACQWLDGATGLTNAEARVKVHNVKGTALEAAGQPAAAAASHAAALAETCPEELSLLVDSARRLAALGQYRGAIEGLERQMQHLTENISRARTHYELAKLKLDAGLADSAREHLCHLRDLPRAQLAGDLARDAGYWKTKIGRGDVPAELGNLVSSSGSERDVK
jgi:tetratricopeptide (TPR) repeat protein